MSDTTGSQGFGTRAIHAGQAPDPSTGAIMTPIFQSATFAQESPGVFKEDYDYSRASNPTRKALEKNLASLEGAAFGLCYASGCSAEAAVLHLLKGGDHVILCDDVYGGTNRLFHHVFNKAGVEVTLVDMTDLDAFDGAFRDSTRVVWLETPTNPTLKIIDIAKVAQRAHAQGAIVCVDNTFCSPYLQSPMALGADIVCHSTTKYMGGHSDVIGGALLMNDADLFEKLKFIQLSVGAVPGILDCFLMLRSTKTLHVRMQRHCENAMRIAKWLENHAKVERVLYPGLESHPQYLLAREQMPRGFGGMITIYVKGGLDAANAMLKRTELFTIAESLGGVESLIEHPGIMTHASVPPEQRDQLGITDSLVRLSVGIEDADDLIADLDYALA